MKVALSSPERMGRSQLGRFVVGVAIVAATVTGWRLFWFLTDDAHIAFRYAANSLAGRGLVWNPAPFRPVEGYTSFLWVVLLREIWRITGLEPPVTANPLSLVFGLATLWLVRGFVARMRLPAAFEAHRRDLLALALAGIVTNRTFLTWLSSGLETAMFNFLVAWWVFEALAPATQRWTWALRLSTAASAAALTRPDGLLAVVATPLLLVLNHDWWNSSRLGRVSALTPLLAVPAHTAWRRMTYGEWLPNTYYAKWIRPWPQAGIRYLGSFVVEYGLWLWLAMLLAWLVLRGRAAWAGCAGSARSCATIATVLAVLVAHAGYYVLRIGGDHFEYRVLSHLVPLVFVASVWLVVQLADRAWRALLLLGGLVLVSLPIPWCHWLQTRDLVTRPETHGLVKPIAAGFPPGVRALVSQWDDWQAWLIRQGICRRHQEHKVFYYEQTQGLGGRAEGAALSWDDRPVMEAGSVGVVGWLLPNVAIIDSYGLNDRVVARHPVELASGKPRMMAHDRVPPAGYVECFRPNVRVSHHRPQVTPRAVPLSDDDIRRCEARIWN